MRNVVVAIAASVLLSGAPSKANAQPATTPSVLTDPQPAIRELTLDQVLALAQKENTQLGVERARFAQAQTNLEMAWSVLFPTVTAQGKFTRNNREFKFPVSTSSQTGQAGPPEFLTIQPTNQWDGSVTIAAPILAPAAYPAIEAVRSGVGSSEAEFVASKTAILFGVAEAFYAAAIADEMAAARQSSIDVAKATLRNAQTRFEAGTVTKVDVARAELAVLRVEQLAREARFGTEQAYRALTTLIHAQAAFKVRPSPDPPVNRSSPDLHSALQLRPEFRTLELALKSTQARRRAYAWRWAPTLSAFGNARIFNYDNFAREHRAWAVGATLDWVLYDGGNRDVERHRTLAQERELTARATGLRDAIRDELADTRGRLETKQHAHDTAERAVVLATETLDLVRTQYEAGNTAQVDLLQAQDGLTLAKEDLARAHYEMAIADLALRRAAGTFPGD
jgi:outer membrane protein TolC